MMTPVRRGKHRLIVLIRLLHHSRRRQRHRHRIVGFVRVGVYTISAAAAAAAVVVAHVSIRRVCSLDIHPARYSPESVSPHTCEVTTAAVCEPSTRCGGGARMFTVWKRGGDALQTLEVFGRDIDIDIGGEKTTIEIDVL